jgi:hypothetical protein
VGVEEFMLKDPAAEKEHEFSIAGAYTAARSQLLLTGSPQMILLPILIWTTPCIAYRGENAHNTHTIKSTPCAVVIKLLNGLLRKVNVLDCIMIGFDVSDGTTINPHS